MRKAEGAPWPDLGDAALKTSIEDWLAPALVGKTGLGDVKPEDLQHALQALLTHDQVRRLDAEAPAHWVAPTGSQLLVDYAADGGPAIAVRVRGALRPRAPIRRSPAVAYRSP